MASGGTRLISYHASPTLRRFHGSTAFVRGVMGPVGSGKSVGCCFELFSKCMKQAPGVDGVRRTRVVVVRNTLPQLETTTIKTWLDWFPESVFGHMTRKPPYTQMIKYRLPDGTTMAMEVIFMALDKPEDVKKLLSLEATWIWFNEAREIELEIVHAATARVGRFPSVKDRPETLPAEQPWPTHYGVILDTNPPDDEHWWYQFAELDAWRRDPDTGSLKPLDIIPDAMRFEFFRQPSGTSREAENVDNLPPGYYDKISVGKTPEWVRVYVQGEYGFVMVGKPVYRNSYNPKLHKAEKPIPIDPFLSVQAGLDCSGRNPAVIFYQKGLNGHQWRAVHEFVCEDMGAELFAKLLVPEVKLVFPHNDIEWWGDPAGFNPREGDERTYVQIVEAVAKSMQLPMKIKPAPTNRINPRIAAVEALFLRLGPGGQPAVLISPACKTFVRGLEGGYKYRRLQVSGTAQYSVEPEKNRFSDIQDGNQYVVCGGMGEYKRVTGKAQHGTGRVGIAADISKWTV